MRNLVIARITELWTPNSEEELDLHLHELPELSNKELLQVLEEMIELIGLYD